MNQPEVEHVVQTGEARPFRPLGELEAEERKMNRRERRATVRARRRKGQRRV